MIHSTRIAARLRLVLFIAALFGVVLIYLLPLALTIVLGAGLTIGWAVGKLLESLS